MKQVQNAGLFTEKLPHVFSKSVWGKEGVEGTFLSGFSKLCLKMSRL